MPAIHRHTDSRNCGATTTVTGQSTVFSNDLLWAVHNDPNSHGSGGLIPSGSTVYCEDKLVIVHAPDSAQTDNQNHANPRTNGGSGDCNAY